MARARLVRAASASTTTSPGCSAACRTMNSAADTPASGWPCRQRGRGGEIVGVCRCAGVGGRAGEGRERGGGQQHRQRRPLQQMQRCTSGGSGWVLPKPSDPCTKSAIRSLATPLSDLRAPSTTGTSGRPARSRSRRALQVAKGVGTLPYIVVIPTISMSSGLLKAARMAMASSAHREGRQRLSARLGGPAGPDQTAQN